MQSSVWMPTTRTGIPPRKSWSDCAPSAQRPTARTVTARSPAFPTARRSGLRRPDDDTEEFTVMYRPSTICALVFSLSLALAGPVRTQEDAPLPAKQIVQEAQQKAKKQKKGVMVIFHASWCGWCHKLEDVMNRP